jgi:hypothetical protein
MAEPNSNNNGLNFDSLLNIGKPNLRKPNLLYTGNTASVDSIYDPITNSQSFADSVKTAAKPTYTPVAVPQTQEEGFDSLKFFGSAADGLTGLGSLLQAYNGYKQLQLGREAFDFGKSSYNQDTANQARLTNSELEDRQRARIGSTGNNNANGTYESLDSYMAKNRVSANPI